MVLNFKTLTKIIICLLFIICLEQIHIHPYYYHKSLNIIEKMIIVFLQNAIILWTYIENHQINIYELIRRQTKINYFLHYYLKIYSHSISIILLNVFIIQRQIYNVILFNLIVITLFLLLSLLLNKVIALLSNLIILYLNAEFKIIQNYSHIILIIIIILSYCTIKNKEFTGVEND